MPEVATKTTTQTATLGLSLKLADAIMGTDTLTEFLMKLDDMIYVLKASSLPTIHQITEDLALLRKELSKGTLNDQRARRIIMRLHHNAGFEIGTAPLGTADAMREVVRIAARGTRAMRD